MINNLSADGYIFDADAGIWHRPGSEIIAYNDGTQIENIILHKLLNARDRTVHAADLSGEDIGWPYRYHLSPLRCNLLKPLSGWMKGKNILEVGSGFGILSRYMGEAGADVIALEGTPRRAAGSAARCRDLDSVTVVADNLQDFPQNRLFDMVTLVGVLEYSRKYFNDGVSDPVNRMLAHAKTFLKPDGILLLAIENQLGLKYFAGFGEDHNGVPFYGIEDRYHAQDFVTFGRTELSERLSDAGYAGQHWMYPFPDYKIPTVILNHKASLETGPEVLAETLAPALVTHVQKPGQLGFSMTDTLRPICRNRLLGDVANSFLILAARDAQGLPELPADIFNYS